MIELATSNLLSPMVLFFVLGLSASLARSDLSIPEAIAKGMSLYLMMAIGFKGGAGVARVIQRIRPVTAASVNAASAA